VDGILRNCDAFKLWLVNIKPDIDEDLSTEGLLRGAPAPQLRQPGRQTPTREGDTPTGE